MGKSKQRGPGPDPVVGIALVIFGVLIMGIGGAATAHYLFNVGTVLAVVGAMLFVAFVTLSTLRDKRMQREAGEERDTPPGTPPIEAS
jgi:uncharacterized membrane protein HdeD (DUF308 family)